MVKDEEFPDGYQGIVDAYEAANAWSQLGEDVNIFIIDEDGTRLLRTVEKQAPRVRTLEDGWNDIS